MIDPVILTITEGKIAGLCPDCGHAVWIENSIAEQTYKKCRNEKCGFKLVIT